MKKFFVTILAFVYIGTSMGATIHIHYCMGKMANWSLDFNTSKTCEKCGMDKSDKKDKGCCKDEDKFIKSDSDQRTAETGFQSIEVNAIGLPVSFFEISFFHFSSIAEKNSRVHSPQRSSGVPLYILTRTFLI